MEFNDELNSNKRDDTSKYGMSASIILGTNNNNGN